MKEHKSLMDRMKPITMLQYVINAHYNSRKQPREWYISPMGEKTLELFNRLLEEEAKQYIKN